MVVVVVEIEVVVVKGAVTGNRDIVTVISAFAPDEVDGLTQCASDVGCTVIHHVGTTGLILGWRSNVSGGVELVVCAYVCVCVYSTR